MEKVSVTKSSQSHAKQPSSAYTLSKSSKKLSKRMVSDGSLQTSSNSATTAAAVVFSPVKTRSNLKMKTIESVNVTSSTTLTNYVSKSVKICLVDLIHTDLLTRGHRRQLQKLKEKKLGLSFSICPSFDSHSDVSGFSFRINNRRLRSLPVRNERVKRESSLLSKCTNESNCRFGNSKFSRGSGVSIVEKFRQRESQTETASKDNDEDKKKWRFWNGDLTSDGGSTSSRGGSICPIVKSFDSDIFSSDEPEIIQKHKRSRKQTQKLSSLSKQVPRKGKKRGRKPKPKPLKDAAAVKQLPQTSTPVTDNHVVTETKTDKNKKKNCQPKITMRRTVVTWSGDKKTTWILNVMPKSEAERTGKLDAIKKTRLSRNPLYTLKRSSSGVPQKRRPYKKRIKKENIQDDESKKVKMEVNLLEEKSLGCDELHLYNAETDLVVYKLPSMPAIDIHGDTKKQIKSDLFSDVETKPNLKKDTNKREISSVAISNQLPPNSEPPPKLRKLNDGKKHLEIIEDTILPPDTVIALISSSPKNLKAVGRIPKINLNTKGNDEKLKDAFNNWAKIPDLMPLISPTSSVIDSNKLVKVENTTPVSTKSQMSKIVYDVPDNDKKSVPLTMKNVQLFSKMIEGQLKNNVNENRSESKVKLRISRFSTREDNSNKKSNDSNNNNVTSSGKGGKKSRKDWKKESSQVNDGTNTSTESFPLVTKYTQSNSDDSLPRFGQNLVSASNPSTSDMPLERRVFDWIYQDLDVSDDKNIKDLDLSDNSSSTLSEILEIDDEKGKNKNEVDNTVLKMDHSIEHVTFADESTTIKEKSVNEPKQSVAEEDDINEKDDTLSISSSSSSDSDSSSSCSSSSSSASLLSSSSNSIDSIINTSIKKSLEVVEPEQSSGKAPVESDVDKIKLEDNENQDLLKILDNDKCDDDKGYVSIIDDNNSVNNSEINDKSINDKKSSKVDDSINEKRLESDVKEKEGQVKEDEKKLEIDSVLDDNNMEKKKSIEVGSNNNDLQDLEEKAEESDSDAISLYAESLWNEKLDKTLVSPELPTFGNPLKPPSPQNEYNRMESNTFDNYYQLTEQEFDNDYQTVNIQSHCNGLTTRRFRNRLNNNKFSIANESTVECDSSYARSPNSHTINNDNTTLDQPNTFNTHQIDSNYNNIANKKLQQGYEQNFTKQRNVYDPEVKKSDPNKDYVKQFFYGNCFQHLKTGNCTKNNQCRHSHSISNKLRCIYLDTPEKIHVTLFYAFEQNFHFYLRTVYSDAIIKLNVNRIIDYFDIVLISNKIKRELIPDYLRWTINALLAKNRTLKSIIQVLTIKLMQMGNIIRPIITPGEVCNVIVSHLATKINAGCYWETFRSLMYNQVSLSPVIISYVLQESIEFNKPLAHLQDIQTFLSSYLSDEDNFMGINPELYHRFTLLFHEESQKEQAVYMENVVEIRQKPLEAISLASPDTMDINSLPNNNAVNTFIHSINENKYIPEKDLIQLQNNTNYNATVTTTNDNNNNNNKNCNFNNGNINDNLKTKDSVINSVDNQQKIEEKVDPVPSTSRTDNTQKLFANRFKLIPIDAPKPKSIYENHVWLLRSDLESIQKAIRKNDYDGIIEILSVNKRAQGQPFVRGFYTILCKEIMESVRHLNEIIQRTVRAGLYVKLKRLLTDTGVMLLITLIDNNYWVLAYHLLQSLNLYLINTDHNTVEFVYVSMEIYIANHKPLKAVELIKRNNMIIGDIRKWKVKSMNEKKALKAHGYMMSILLKSLAYFCPEYAVELCLKVIDEQKNVFYPINLTHVITEIVNNVLTDIIDAAAIDNDINITNTQYIFTKLSKVILSHNAIVYDELLRNIIIEVYHTDEKLSRQLFKYATQMGIYTTVKYEVDSAITLTINTNLSEEEMYLLLVESFAALKRRIGCNIYMMQPHKLVFYLNFEIIPDRKMLCRDRIKLKNNVQIMKETKAMLARVFEKFNPKLKMLSRSIGQRVCKMVSYTVFSQLIKDEA